MVSDDELWQRFDDACAMGNGEGQVRQVRHILREAERVGHSELLVQARLEHLGALILWAESADFATAESILRDLPAAFVPCLAMHDRRPELFGVEELDRLWAAFGITVRSMIRAAALPAPRLRGLIDDMARRCRPDRDDEATLCSLRVDLEARAGDIAAADAALGRMRTRRPPGYWDEGGEVLFAAEYFADLERDEEAIATLEPLVTDPDLAAYVVLPDGPDTLCAHLVLPYLRTGRLEEARAAYARAWPHVADADDDKLRALMVEFHARSGNEDREWAALREEGVVEGPPRTYDEMRFAACVALLLRRLVELGRGGETIALYPDDEGDGEPRIATAAEYLPQAREEAMAFARRADAHNGTRYQSERVRALIDAAPIVDGLPLPDDR